MLEAHNTGHATSPSCHSSVLSLSSAYSLTLFGVAPIVKRMPRPVFHGEEKGTGARGAPVPEVGRGVKFKRGESRKPGSHPNEGQMNSR